MREILGAGNVLLVGVGLHDVWDVYVFKKSSSGTFQISALYYV